MIYSYYSWVFHRKMKVHKTEISMIEKRKTLKKSIHKSGLASKSKETTCTLWLFNLLDPFNQCEYYNIDIFI